MAIELGRGARARTGRQLPALIRPSSAAPGAGADARLSLDLLAALLPRHPPAEDPLLERGAGAAPPLRLTANGELARRPLGGQSRNSPGAAPPSYRAPLPPLAAALVPGPPRAHVAFALLSWTPGRRLAPAP